jgi:transcriptional regulator with XRE-family HTH domain
MNRIKELREKKNWRQKDLAILLNTAPQTVSHYEKEDRDLPVDTIFRLCDIFGCSADYLLGRSELPVLELSPEETALLQAWRKCDVDTKAGLMLILKPFWEEASDGKAI